MIIKGCKISNRIIIGGLILSAMVCIADNVRRSACSK